jgi:cyclopropane-fatty-acyl-phospholipid synthase
MTVLDIGCGWGEALKFAAERYHAVGVGVTVSEQQVTLASELCRELPIDIRLQDYHEVSGRFDCVFSIGMFEHVGFANYRRFFELVRSCLADDGLFIIEDWHNFGTDYDRTLQAWRDNVERAWPALGERYNERFRRMWHYYLSTSMATFRARRSPPWQIVLSPRGLRGGYVAPR